MVQRGYGTSAEHNTTYDRHASGKHCNQFAAQQWGYDPAGGTIYLRESLPVSGANAHFCLDLWGGNIAAGTNVGSAYCDNCWNQK